MPATRRQPLQIPELPPNTLSPFELCDTAEQVTNSLPILRNADYLAIDCEGDDLGYRYGRLSLLSIGACRHCPQNQASELPLLQIFVYDAMVLPTPSLKQIFAFLSDPKILKVVWDGRMDSTELLYTYQTTIDNVVDLQIADVMSRSKRGETDRKRKERLSTFFRELHLEKYWEEYDQVHMLLGMGKCLEEYRLIKNPEEGKDPQMKALFRRDVCVWIDRPLPPALVHYAAKDIHFIHLIYTHFFIQSYLFPLEEIISASRRYVTIHANRREKPSRHDCYRSSPVLPLDILEPPGGDKYACEGCQRRLTLTCYYNDNYKRNRMCRVCRVVGQRLGRAITDMKDKESWVDV